MSSQARRWFIIAMVAGGTVLAGASVAAAGTPIDETRPAGPDAVVSVNNLNGTISVTAWDRDEVHVTGTLGEGPDRLEVTGDKDRIRVEVVWPENSRHQGGDATDLVLRVPKGARLRLEGVNGDVTSSGTVGPVDAQSVNGNVSITAGGSDVSAKTVNGDVTVTGGARRVKAGTVSGGITVRDAGDVTAGTVSGDLEIFGDRFTAADLSTVSGDIRFSGGLDPKGSFDFEAHSGDLTLGFPSGVSADFSVSTFSGDIDNQFGPQARRTGEHAPGKELRFSTGGGGAQVTVNSFSGNVSLVKQ